MEHLLIFGAGGRTGRHLLDVASAAGLRTTAFVRRPEGLGEVPPTVRVVIGDARDRGALDAAFDPRPTAVIAALSGGGAGDVVGPALAAIVDACERHGVSRLVTTSAYGIVADRPRLIAPIVRRAFAAEFADQARGDDAVAASSLDWTIARGTRLTNRPSKRPARVETQPLHRGPWSLPRAAYARVLVDLATRDAHAGLVVHVTGG